jgi:hypothetical protein
MSKETNYTGIGFFGMLTILFIGLKLTGFVDWSWVWVLSPLWGSFLIGVMIIGIGITILTFIKTLTK